MAGVLLCSRRTVAGGALLSLSALVNVVVVDTAFEIRGALPIATVMASAAFALVIVHLDVSTLQALVWRRHENVVVSHSMRGRILWAGALTLVFGFPLYMNLAARRGLGGQVSPAGRWEVVECYPTPGLAMCQSQGDKTAPILYIEVGQWGQLVTGSERRNASVSYDQARGSLEVRIAPSNSANEPDLVLTGTVHERDTTVVLHGQAAGVVPFQVRLQRTHWAPWPPVRAF